jgi:anion transporter
MSEYSDFNGEVKEVITEGEEKFEKWRNTVGLFLGPLCALIYFLSPLETLTYQAHTLAAILIWVIIWWVTEPIPIPASTLLGAALCILFNVADAKKVFAPFADPIVFLFMGSFIIAGSMAKHNVDKRFAYKILSIKGVVKSTGRIIFTFGAIAAFISMWISNTAATAMMYPIAIGIIHTVAEMIKTESGKNINVRKMRFATALMLMTAYSASIGGIGTPVGTPPNLIGIAMIEKFAHVKISFFQWMQFAVPMLIVMYFVLFILLYFLNKPEAGKLEHSGDLVEKQIKKLGKIKRGEINSLVAFGITVVLWVAPGFLAIIYGSGSEVYKAYNNYMPESVAALTGAILLFLMPVNLKKREFTINWKDAVNIDWGTLILFGGGLALGNLMFDTKLADAIGKGIMDFGGFNTVWGITFASIYIAIIVSEATSNTASANMIVPVVISICVAGNINPIPPAIGATLGASWGFMLPVSTAPNAIVYGSKMVPITRMIRSGIFFDIIGGALIWLVLRIMLPLMNFS